MRMFMSAMHGVESRESRVLREEIDEEKIAE